MAGVDDTRKQVLGHRVSYNIWAIIAAVLLACCAASVLLFNVVDARMALAVVCTLGTATFLAALRIKDDAKPSPYKVMQNPAPLDGAALVAGMPEGTMLYGRDGSAARGDCLESYAMNDALSRKFVLRPVWAEITSERYRFPDDVLPFTAFLKDDRDKELSKFAALRPDKVVVGLESDLIPELFESERPTIMLHRITRYAVQVTDDAFNKVIIDKNRLSDKIVFSGRSLSLSPDGSMLPLDESKAANEVDVHSLLISSDGYIMFAKGTKHHPLCPDQVIASAACSLLPDEVDGRPVQEAMIDSIHRKIHVLYDIPDGVSLASSFCGFARMTVSGGAPEFYCLSRIGMTKDELIAAHRDPSSGFVSGMLRASVPDLEDVEDAAEYIATASHSLRKAVGDDISLSASAMLTAVIGAMSDPETAGRVLRRIGVIAACDERGYVDGRISGETVEGTGA